MQHRVQHISITMSNRILSMKLSPKLIKEKAPNQKGIGRNNKKGPMSNPEKAPISTNPHKWGALLVWRLENIFPNLELAGASHTWEGEWSNIV